MFGKMKVLALTGALAATAFAATGAQAAGWIVGLVDGKSIVTIDPASRKVASKIDVKGAGPLAASMSVRPMACSTASRQTARSSPSISSRARPR
jgi:hypothetical protein